MTYIRCVRDRRVYGAAAMCLDGLGHFFFNENMLTPACGSKTTVNHLRILMDGDLFCDKCYEISLKHFEGKFQN